MRLAVSGQGVDGNGHRRKAGRLSLPACAVGAETCGYLRVRLAKTGRVIAAGFEPPGCRVVRCAAFDAGGRS
jgi:hypothetical protein